MRRKHINQGTRTEEKNFYYLFDKLLAPVDRTNSSARDQIKKILDSEYWEQKEEPDPKTGDP